MSTLARSICLVKNLTLQLRNLSVTGARRLHLSSAARKLGVLKNNGVISQISNVHVNQNRPISAQSRPPTDTHQLPFMGVMSRENRAIKESEKPKIRYECPKIPGLNIEIDTPSSVNSNIQIDIPEQKERIRESPGNKMPDMKMKKNVHMTIIRRKKMKKHQRQRMRNRLWPILRREKFLRDKKKTRLLEAHLEKLRSYGRNFDAKDFVKDSLHRAKIGGYQLDMNPTIKMILTSKK